MYKYVLILATVILIPIQNALAEEVILISRSDHIDDVIVDGRWTTPFEWKASSWDKIGYETNLRTAHHGDFMYIMIDTEDRTFDRNFDRAVICFDTKNEKSQVPDENDYCFSVAAGSSNVATLQGGSPLANNDYFKRISGPENVTASSDMSGQHNRYTKIPHVIYEFKIPVEFLQRSDSYGFLVSVYDHSRDQQVTFPAGLSGTGIALPSQWGNIVSPDRSLPEFDAILIILIASMIAILIGRFKKGAMLQDLR